MSMKLVCSLNKQKDVSPRKMRITCYGNATKPNSVAIYRFHSMSVFILWHLISADFVVLLHIDFSRNIFFTCFVVNKMNKKKTTTNSKNKNVGATRLVLYFSVHLSAKKRKWRHQAKFQIPLNCLCSAFLACSALSIPFWPLHFN